MGEIFSWMSEWEVVKEHTVLITIKLSSKIQKIKISSLFFIKQIMKSKSIFLQNVTLGWDFQLNEWVRSGEGAHWSKLQNIGLKLIFSLLKTEWVVK